MLSIFSKKPKADDVPTYEYAEPGICHVRKGGFESTILVVNIPAQTNTQEAREAREAAIAGKFEQAVSIRFKRKIDFMSPGALAPWMQMAAQQPTGLRALARVRGLDNMTAAQLGRTECYMCFMLLEGVQATSVLSQLIASGAVPVLPEYQREVLTSLNVSVTRQIELRVDEDIPVLDDFLMAIGCFADITTQCYVTRTQQGYKGRTYMKVDAQANPKLLDQIQQTCLSYNLPATIMAVPGSVVSMLPKAKKTRKGAQDPVDLIAVSAEGLSQLDWLLEQQTVELPYGNPKRPGLLLLTPDQQLHAVQPNLSDQVHGCWMNVTHAMSTDGYRAAQTVIKELALAHLIGNGQVTIVGGRATSSDFYELIGTVTVHLDESSKVGLNPFSILGDNDQVFGLICSLLNPSTDKEVEALQISFDDVQAGHYPRTMQGLLQAMRANFRIEDQLRDDLMLLLNGPYGRMFQSNVDPGLQARSVRLTWCPMMQKAVPQLGTYLLQLLAVQKRVTNLGVAGLVVLQNHQQWLSSHEDQGHQKLLSEIFHANNGLVVVHPSDSDAAMDCELARRALMTLDVCTSNYGVAVDVVSRHEGKPLKGATLVLDNFASTLHE